MTRFLLLRFLLAAAFLIGLGGAPARAQADIQTAGSPPGHVAVVEGTVTLEHDGQVESAAAAVPLVPGDRIRTENGRVEAILADNSLLQLDSFTSVDLLADALLRLLNGHLRLVVPGAERLGNARFRVDTPAASISILDPGEYRIDLLSGPAVELTVLRGNAIVENDHGSAVVHAGERSLARTTGVPMPALAFNSAAWDGFDIWAQERRNARLGTVSSRYLPGVLQPYTGTFDYYGVWRPHTTFGYVWYPRVVLHWRPYFFGRWRFMKSFGWTWIGFDPWAWPTHHFGRWGYGGGTWFWIPTRHWGPAWVSWAFAPRYAAWCPLGFDGRPVVSVATLTALRHWDRTIHQTSDVHQPRGLNDASRVQDPPTGWTAVPRQVLGSARAVAEHAVDAQRLPPAERAALVARPGPAAAPPGRAIERSSRPVQRPPLDGASAPVGKVTTREGEDPVTARRVLRVPTVPPAGAVLDRRSVPIERAGPRGRIETPVTRGRVLRPESGDQSPQPGRAPGDAVFGRRRPPRPPGPETVRRIPPTLFGSDQGPRAIPRGPHALPDARPPHWEATPERFLRNGGAPPVPRSGTPHGGTRPQLGSSGPAVPRVVAPGVPGPRSAPPPAAPPSAAMPRERPAGGPRPR